MDVIIVWHRRDLRLHDNAALFYASKKNCKIVPVFVIDPFFFEGERLDCNDRIIFMFECLKDLKKNYKEKLGLEMNFLFGNSIEVLNNIKNKLNAKVYFNADSSMIFGFKRDKKALQDKDFVCFDNDAIVRGTSNSRINWSEKANEYFEGEELNFDMNKKYNGLILKDVVEIDDIIKKYKIVKEKEFEFKGGESEALKRLDKFVKLHIQNYASSISKPSLSVINCSRLSAHFSLGALSLRRAYKKTKEEHVSGRAKQFFITRLFWNQHFTQKLEDFPQSSELSINPALRNLNKDNFNYDYIRAFKEGKTGFPLIDASIRYLVRTGWLNFRMRAMLASFYSFILKQYWKDGADFMHKNLIDADIAINYQQWQMQSGLVGVHPLRIYNPTKQIFDNDSKGIFIRKEVEELSLIEEIEWLANPWKYYWQIKEKYGFDVREKYPKPIVDFDLEAKKTREFFKEKHTEIKNALGIKSVIKHASLSKRKQKIKKSKDDKNRDKKLDKFF